MNPLSVILISDPHYYSKKNWINVDPYKFPAKREQQYRRGSEEILKFIGDEICKEGEPEIVLINGDLTNNGELTSHEEMRELLRSLKARGKRVYVTTATHDYRDNGHSYGYDENNNEVEVPAFSREDLYDYYFEFGMNEAISIHKPSMSYTVNLNDEYVLLALNDDHGKHHAGYTDDCFEWIKDQVTRAQAQGKFVVAMTHHPVLAPSPLYKLIGKTDVIENGEETAKWFADLGVNHMFTGHSHIHNISSITSESGNVFHDVSTSAAVGFPPYYRHATFNPDARTLSVNSTLVKEVPGLETNGLSLSDFMEKQFLGVVEDMLYTAEHDYEAFKPLANGISIRPDKAEKLKPIIRPAAKFLNRLTFGRVWRITRLHNDVKRKEIKAVKKKPVVPFVISIVANLYRGDADLDKSGVDYRLAVGTLRWLEFLTKPLAGKLKGAGIDSISGLILPLLHKEGVKDSEAELKF